MTSKKCSIWWCEKKHYALGLCKAHWAGLKRYGHPYGKNHEHMDKFDDEILKARLIALKVTEFEEEFLNNFRETGRPKNVITCPFCMSRNNEHKPLCIVLLSKSLLEKTSRCYNK